MKHPQNTVSKKWKIKKQGMGGGEDDEEEEDENEEDEDGEMDNSAPMIVEGVCPCCGCRAIITIQINHK